MSIKDLSPPAREPLELAYVKTFLRVDHDAEDALISDLIVAARMHVEGLIRASLITRRQSYATSKLSDAGLYINHGPVAAVYGVKLYDPCGTEIGVSMTDVHVDLRAVPARLCLRETLRWHDYARGPLRAEIELDAGYGTDTGDIPMPLRQALLLLIAQSFESRGQEGLSSVPMMVDALLMPYRSLKL